MHLLSLKVCIDCPKLRPHWNHLKPRSVWVVLVILDWWLGSLTCHETNIIRWSVLFFPNQRKFETPTLSIGVILMHFSHVTVTIPHWTKMPKLCRLLHLYVLEWTLFDDHVAFPIISWYICIFLFAYHGEALINCQALYFFQESLLQVFSGLSRVVWELWAVWLTPNLCRFDLGGLITILHGFWVVLVVSKLTIGLFEHQNPEWCTPLVVTLHLSMHLPLLLVATKGLLIPGQLQL